MLGYIIQNTDRGNDNRLIKYASNKEYDIGCIFKSVLLDLPVANWLPDHPPLLKDVFFALRTEGKKIDKDLKPFFVCF